MPSEGQPPAGGDAEASTIAAQRGPRLALTDAASGKAKGTADAATGKGTGDPADAVSDAPPPEPPAGGRPSLKRIK